jgi:hypothetical protein
VYVIASIAYTHPVYGAEVPTHNLFFMSPLLFRLGHGSHLLIGLLLSIKDFVFYFFITFPTDDIITISAAETPKRKLIFLFVNLLNVELEPVL